jgi:hypothetical protein
LLRQTWQQSLCPNRFHIGHWPHKLSKKAAFKAILPDFAHEIGDFMGIIDRYKAIYEQNILLR